MDTARDAIGSKRALYHEPDQVISLGCLQCPERGICGGLQTSLGAFDCTVHCDCDDPAACDSVCPASPERLAMRSIEVGGFDLRLVPEVGAVRSPELPSYIPLLYHGSRRIRPFRSPVVALPLRRLFSRRTGRLTVRDRSEAADRFRFSRSAALVVDGVAPDRFLEAYWEKGRWEGIVAALAALAPALITTPNFSLFADVPRWDNLHGMKRIAIAWRELASAGIPTALHLNARTDRDWDRWIEFLRIHEEIDTISFEFGTGAAVRSRADLYIDKLRMVATEVPRGLRLVMRGGLPHLTTLGSAFERVCFIDTSAFVRTHKRRLATVSAAGPISWDDAITLSQQPLDSLLEHNARSVRCAVERHITIPGDN